MPTMPEYDQKVSLQPVKGGQMDAGAFTDGWKSFTEMAGTIKESVDSLKKVRDFNEVSSSEIALKTELSQIQAASQNEKDPTKIQFYKEKIDAAITKHSESISDKVVQQEAKNKFSNAGLSTYTSIADDFRKKTIDIAGSNFLMSAEMYERDYVNASNSIDREAAKLNYFSALKKAKEAGVYDAADATKMEIAQQKKFDQRDIAFDVEHLPEMIAEKRKAGYYKNLNDEEFKLAQDTANNLIEKRKEQAKKAEREQSVVGDVKFIERINSGDFPTIDETVQMMGTKEMSTELGLAYINYKTNPRSVRGAYNSMEFVNSLDEVFAAKDKKAINNVVTKIFNGGADGRTNKDEMNDFLKFAILRSQQLADVEGSYEPGNIDLKNRPRVKNADGSISTVRSMSFSDMGREVLIPTVSDSGKIMSAQEAIDTYKKTGRHLGKFNSIEAANAHAEKIHLNQAEMLNYAPNSGMNLIDNAYNGLKDWARKMNIPVDQIGKMNQQFIAWAASTNAKADKIQQEQSKEVLKAMALVSPVYRSFIGKERGDTVTLPNGVSVKYNGFIDGDVDFEVIK